MMRLTGTKSLHGPWRRVFGLAGALLFFMLVEPIETADADPCATPPNPIVAENCLPGTPQSVWDVNGSGSATIQGFATDISVDQGQTVQFKIDTPATAYHLDIYRMGYYQGNGARLVVGGIQPTAPLPQNQPACLDQPRGPFDCGNWAVSASWNVPTTATSGIYFARLARDDGTAGASQIFFIVRDDDGRSNILFQTSDETWQAYNRYGGASLYYPTLPGRDYKVSYDRPFVTRDCCAHDFVFNAEYPMVRWLEQNGYDVSYFTGVDAARRGSEMLEHTVYLTDGHDEYWSGQQRANVQAAVNAGVNVAFFTGNDIFWKTRWENSIDGTSTPYRTLVCYKDTHANQAIDPVTWTGTWRDPRFAPAGTTTPEDSLGGSLFTVNGPRSDNITVSSTYSKLRLWRNTAVASLAPGSSITLPKGTLGYEWNEDVDNGFRPAGLFDLSSTTVPGVKHVANFGSDYLIDTATHSLTEYRAASGALVFAAGTMQWSWGLDKHHDLSTRKTKTSQVIQQATVNLLADMGVQPGSLATTQQGLVPATASTDTTAPSASVGSIGPTNTVTGTPVTVSGSASDAGGGVVAGVEVLVDPPGPDTGTWHPANGTSSWSKTFTPEDVGTFSVSVRSVDDSGNLGAVVSAGTVTVGPRSCPCSLWDASAVPRNPAVSKTGNRELGVRFTPLVNGRVTGIRFYKGTSASATYQVHLFQVGNPTPLATASATLSTVGWQQVPFSTSVPVTQGVAYVAAYYTPIGRWAEDAFGFALQGRRHYPLEAPRDFSPDGVGTVRDGLFRTGSPGLPTVTVNSTNYWVDVVFTTP